MIFIPHWHGEQDSIQLCSTSISSFLSPVIKKGCEWMVLALEMSGIVEDVLCQTQAKSEAELVFTMYIRWRDLFLPHPRSFYVVPFSLVLSVVLCLKEANRTGTDINTNKKPVCAIFLSFFFFLFSLSSFFLFLVVASFVLFLLLVDLIFIYLIDWLIDWWSLI